MQAVCVCDAVLFAEQTSSTLVFEELILDERYTQKGLIVEETLLKRVGGVNHRLKAKWEYELILRLSTETTIFVMTVDDDVLLTFRTGELPSSKVSLDDINKQETFDMDSFIADAYVVSRYFTRLQELEISNVILEAMIIEAGKSSNPKQAEALLQQMLQKEEDYYRIYRATQPILIYLGVTYCYNILNMFAKELEAALEKRGERVVYYDTERDDVSKMSELVHKQYKASIGFQTWAMSVRMGEHKEYLQDFVGGPKYNFIVDHPVWLKEQLQSVPNNYYILTHDRDYKDFIQRYFPKVSGVYLLPPGGRISEEQESADKIYNITFLGTYGDYRKKLADISVCVPKVRHFASRYLGVMKKDPELTAERAFQKVLDHYEMVLDKTKFLDLFHQMKSVIQAIMYYYREKVVKTILDAGMELHVYGDTWKESPFSNNKNICIHEAVTAEEGMHVLEQSKISLNVMAWHKDGFTERIADSMLAGAIVVSDWSRQLEECHKKATVLYHLNQLGDLPQYLQDLLENDEKRIELSQFAKTHALQQVTWDVRVEALLKKIEEVEG